MEITKKLALIAVVLTLMSTFALAAEEAAMQESSSSGGILAIGLGIIFLIIMLVVLVAWLWSIVNILTAKNDITWKLLWVVVCFFLGIIGTAVYYFVGKKDRKA